MMVEGVVDGEVEERKRKWLKADLCTHFRSQTALRAAKAE